MNRYRNIPGQRGPSKATASTLCQKCLKRDKFTGFPRLEILSSFRLTLVLVRHYSYECKSTAQERPYVSRPSRTQQLLNPDLVPNLKNETMVDVTERTYALRLQLM